MGAFETTPGVQVSPNTDSLGHTCGKFFALADYAKVKRKSRTFAKPIILTSASYSSAEPTCTFSFSYIVFDNRASYYLYINHKGLRKKSTVLWTASWPTGNYTWAHETVKIGRQETPFQLSFLRTPAPHSVQGTIVLDAFSFDAC
ncbi:hypothetical protein HDE_10678 [Halotydeus destructor]|nr:hypothetical protein HDE_10678 [Halotydeus destructor]